MGDFVFRYYICTQDDNDDKEKSNARNSVVMKSCISYFNDAVAVDEYYEEQERVIKSRNKRERVT